MELSGVRAQYVATSGETIVIPFVVTNRGNAEDAFQLTSTLPPSFQPAFFHDVEGTGHIRAEEPSVTETPRLGIGQKARFVLRARVPVEMSDGFAQAFEIKATSRFDPSVSQAASATLVASAPSLRGTLLVDRTSVKPGDSLSYTLSLTNAGSVEQKATPKETLAITLVRSPIGTPKSHRIILRGLGLRRLRHTVIRPNTPQVKGLVHKLAYLLEVREAGKAP